MIIWLVVSTHLKNISQTGNLPQVGVKIPKIFETTTQMIISQPSFGPHQIPAKWQDVKHPILSSEERLRSSMAFLENGGLVSQRDLHRGLAIPPFFFLRQNHGCCVSFWKAENRGELENDFTIWKILFVSGNNCTSSLKYSACNFQKVGDT